MEFGLGQIQLGAKKISDTFFNAHQILLATKHTIFYAICAKKIFLKCPSWLSGKLGVFARVLAFKFCGHLLPANLNINNWTSGSKYQAVYLSF